MDQKLGYNCRNQVSNRYRYIEIICRKPRLWKPAVTCRKIKYQQSTDTLRVSPFYNFADTIWIS